MSKLNTLSKLLEQEPDDVTSRNDIGEPSTGTVGTGMGDVKTIKYKCPQCGYEKEDKEDATDVICPNCDIPMVIDGNEHENHEEPEGLAKEIPDKLEKLTNLVEEIAEQEEPEPPDVPPELNPDEAPEEDEMVKKLLDFLSDATGVDFDVIDTIFDDAKFELTVILSPDIPPEVADMKDKLADIFGADSANVEVSNTSIKVTMEEPGAVKKPEPMEPEDTKTESRINITKLCQNL